MSFAPEDERPTKQVIVIRRDLKMRRGKEIAQGAHASMAWLRQRVMPHLTPAGVADQVKFSEAERAWLEGSLRKVTVKVGSEADLLAVYDKAIEAGVLVHLITDRGLTEFGGTPTRTCLAVGPDYDDRIDPVTGDLELYLRHQRQTNTPLRLTARNVPRTRMTSSTRAATRPSTASKSSGSPRERRTGWRMLSR